MIEGWKINILLRDVKGCGGLTFCDYEGQYINCDQRPFEILKSSDPITLGGKNNNNNKSVMNIHTLHNHSKLFILLCHII